MKKILILFLFISSSLRAQLLIQAIGSTDICFGFVQLQVVSPQPGVIYDWYAGFYDCSNPTSSVLISSSTNSQFPANSTGEYYCIANSQISNPIKVRVLYGGTFANPNIPIIPSYTGICNSNLVTLCVPALYHDYLSQVTIKWYTNNTLIAGANDSYYTPTQNGYYKFTLKSSICSVTYPAVSDSIWVQYPPQITVSSSVSTNLFNGSTLTLSATYDPSYTYSWKRNNITIPGATSSTLQVTSAGSYVANVITSCGSVLSNAIQVTLNTAPLATISASATTICAGTSATFTATNISGAAYQWNWNGSPVTGANVTMMAEFDHKNPTALRNLVQNGVKLKRYSPDILEAAYKAALDLYSDESGKNPAFKKMYTEYLKYQKTQNQWFSVAELGMDSFLQQHVK